MAQVAFVIGQVIRSDGQVVEDAGQMDAVHDRAEGQRGDGQVGVVQGDLVDKEPRGRRAEIRDGHAAPP